MIFFKCLINNHHSNIDASHSSVSKTSHINLNLPTTLQHSQNGDEFVNEYLRISNKSILGNGHFSPNSNLHQKTSSNHHSNANISQLFDQQHHHNHHHHNHTQQNLHLHQTQLQQHSQNHQQNNHTNFNSNLISTGLKYQHHDNQNNDHHQHNNHHHHHHPNNNTIHSHSSCISSSSNHQPDPELIELFEYTSQFNMDDTINSNITHQTSNHNHLHADSSSDSPSVSSTQSSSPVDQINKNKLDLVVEGHTIKQPKWWADTIISNDSVNTTSSPLIINSSNNGIGNANCITIQRYNNNCNNNNNNNTNTQDDECDSSLFINQHHLHTPSSGNGIMSTNGQNCSNIIELKDLIFNSNEDTDETSSASSRSSASLTLSASNFNVDSFISYSTINPNSISIKPDRIAENENAEKVKDNSESDKKEKPENKCEQANEKQTLGVISTCIVLPSLNDNKTARKRIYTHQNKVSSLIQQNQAQQQVQTTAKVETNPKMYPKTKK